MNHISFGSALREARIAKGLDYDTVSHRLRIRTDILQAIEEADFDHMPPRGYAVNMINAYANYVGLNATDVTRMYLDEDYAYQIGRAHEDAQQNRYLQRNTSAATYRSTKTSSKFSRDSFGETPIYGTSTSRGRKNGGIPLSGRTMIDHDNIDYRSHNFDNEETKTNYTFNNKNADNFQQKNGSSYKNFKSHKNGSRNKHAVRNSQSSNSDTNQPEQQVHPAHRSTMTDRQYLNVYANPQNKSSNKKKYLPFILIAIAIIIILIIIFNLVFCATQDETDNIPITGATITNEENEQDETNTIVETAPTNFTLSYNIANGDSAYVEVYVDGEVQEAKEITGPASKSYTSSNTIQFITSTPDDITVSIDGENQDLVGNSNGIVNITYSFSDILDQWYQDHPNTENSTTSSSSSTSTKQN